MANLQRVSHKPYSPPTSVTWLQLLGKQRKTGTSTVLMAELLHIASRIHPTCDISLRLRLQTLWNYSCYKYLYILWKSKFRPCLGASGRLVSTARFRTHVPQCGISGWVSGIGTCFSSGTSFLNCHYYPVKDPHLFQSSKLLFPEVSKPGDLTIRATLLISLKFKKET